MFEMEIKVRCETKKGENMAVVLYYNWVEVNIYAEHLNLDCLGKLHIQRNLSILLSRIAQWTFPKVKERRGDKRNFSRLIGQII